MTRQVINVGATANDGTGDGLRLAYTKCNDNFNELYNSSITPTVLPNGTSNVSVAENANVTITIAGSANVVNFAGTVSEFTGNIDISTDLAVGNSVTITQDLTIGDQLIINGSFGSNVLPDTNNVRTLGNATLRFASMNTVLVDATGNITTTANISGANIITSGAHVTTGNVTGGNLNTGGQVVATGNITGGNVITAGLVDVTGNVTGGNLNTGGVVIATGNVTAGGFLFGDGGFISNVTAAANVAVTQIANGTSVVGISSSGGNVEITSGGVLTLQTDGTNVEFLVPLDFGSSNVVTTGNVSGGNVLASANVIATGNVSGGNITTVGNVDATGNIAGTYILGDGSQLTGIDSAAISNGTSNVSVATNSDITMGVANSPITIVSGTGLATTGIVSATGNVTATGNVSGGNVIATGVVTATGNVAGGNITTGGLVSATGNITATGNVAGGNAIITGDVTGATITGDGSALTALNGSNITTGTVAAARVATLNQNTTGTAGGLSSAVTVSLTGAVTGSATFTNAGDTATITTTNTADPTITLTGDVTGSGTMTNLGSVSFATTIAANSVALGTDTTGNFVGTGAVSGVGLSGSASGEGAAFTVTSNATSANTGSTIVSRDASGNFSAGTISALSTSAQYADIAEQYLADQEYEPGTVVCIGGVYEITSCGPFNTPAGVISTDPALLMNSELNAGLPVALLGRVPVRVFGPVTKGQKVYADLHGRACRSSEGELIGIALEDNADEGEKLVECMLKL
jgi:hypothetical protein